MGDNSSPFWDDRVCQVVLSVFGIINTRGSGYHVVLSHHADRFRKG